MSPAPLRTPPGKPAPAAPEINFGGMGLYVGGGGLPEGNYCLFFDVRMHQSVDKQTGRARGKERLGVMVTAYDLNDPSAEPREQFYSMGGKAHLSFQPDPATGKSLVLAANSVGTTLNNKTNWFFFLKSLYDCAMPEGVFNNDLTTIDGLWAHVQNIPAPEERKGFASGAKTGDEEQEEFKGGDTIAIVSEILEGGKPWEGTGGLPDAAAPAAPAPKAPPARVAAPPTRPAPGVRVPPARQAVAVPVETAQDDDAILQSALGALGEVLVKPTLKNGGPKLTVRTETFKWLKENADEATAQAVINTYFSSDDKLGELLNQVGYGVVGNRVQPQQ